MTKSVLIIGKPHSGKTTFIAQLYARLDVNNAALKLYKSVENLSPIIEALSSLSKGEEVKPTPTDKTTGITLPIQFGEDMVDLFCPDYGGEQINNIIENREVDEKWKESIAQSENWMLFIRLTNLSTGFDLSNKTIKPDLVKSEPSTLDEYVISDQSAFIELLQIMLYAKGQDAHYKNSKTKLTIVLTCWDEEKNGKTPRAKLEENLPLLLSFIESNWTNDKINIVGLSALGLDLKQPENKDLYLAQGSESFGFIINSRGEEIPDITQLISEAL